MAIAESILRVRSRNRDDPHAARRNARGKPSGGPAWSMSLGKLAMHIAEPSELGNYHARAYEFDTNPPDGPSVTTPGYESGVRLLQSTTRT